MAWIGGFSGSRSQDSLGLITHFTVGGPSKGVERNRSVAKPRYSAAWGIYRICMILEAECRTCQTSAATSAEPGGLPAA